MQESEFPDSNLFSVDEQKELQNLSNNSKQILPELGTEETGSGNNNVNVANRENTRTSRNFSEILGAGVKNYYANQSVIRLGKKPRVRKKKMKINEKSQVKIDHLLPYKVKNEKKIHVNKDGTIEISEEHNTVGKLHQSHLLTKLDKKEKMTAKRTRSIDDSDEIVPGNRKRSRVLDNNKGREKVLEVAELETEPRVDVSTSKKSDEKSNMLNKESKEKKVKIEERYKKESCEKGDTAETAVFN